VESRIACIIYYDRRDITGRRGEIYRCSLIQVHLVERKRALLVDCEAEQEGWSCTRAPLILHVYLSQQYNGEQYKREKLFNQIKTSYRMYTSLPRSSFRKQNREFFVEFSIIYHIGSSISDSAKIIAKYRLVLEQCKCNNIIFENCRY